jgi:hypothetical protein
MRHLPYTLLNSMRRLSFLLLAPAVLALGYALPIGLPLWAQDTVPDTPANAFLTVSNEYFQEVYFKYNPTAGTADGLHQYDTKLEDVSVAGTQKQISALHTWEKRVDAVDPKPLSQEMAADREVLLNSIRSQLLTLEVIQPLAKNPDYYSSGVTNSIFVLMERPYAPAATRLKAVVEREKLIPLTLLEARKNLKNPPKIYTEIALEQIGGLVTFFQNDVPGAFKDPKDPIDPATQAAFAKSNAATIKAMQDYGSWMKGSLLSHSKGDYRLGTDTFRKKLAYDEMVDTPLDKLLEVGYNDLHKNQAEFARVAKLIDPAKTPQQVLAELDAIHPAPDKLLSTFQATFNSLIHFIEVRQIITIPSGPEPTLEETPPFMRATTQASMDPPGPFETDSKKAYFNVTLPEPDWTPAHVAEHMAAFNVGTILSTAVHEAYPGHYVQFLWMPEFPSKIRKVIGANSNIEGWAHYCEQMMLDEGYGQPGTTPTVTSEREANLVRLGQLQDALLRDARFIVSIRMHTDTAAPGEKAKSGAVSDMSFDQAVEFFEKEGYQSPSIATLEVKRGTSDAMYLYYTLGKLEIMKLRADVKKKQGAEFNLEAFHNGFMQQGFVPIKIIREAMLGDDSPTL